MVDDDAAELRQLEKEAEEARQRVAETLDKFGSQSPRFIAANDKLAAIHARIAELQRRGRR